MKIAIVGVGGIGSTFGVKLAGAGHDVTVIARNRRLAQLRDDGGIKTRDGVARVDVSGELSVDVEYDLVLVTVLAHQLEPLLPDLAKSRARCVMFMFNTLASLSTLRTTVGDRFAFGFPSVLAQVGADGVLETDTQDKGLLTTVTESEWAEVFTKAGIPAVTTPDMESWLRSHAAAIVPFMLAAGESYRTKRGISWSRARDLAAAMKEAFALVRELGHEIIPFAHAFIGKLPAPIAACVLWIASRVGSVRASGAMGDAEPRALIDAMQALAKRELPALARVRPPG